MHAKERIKVVPRAARTVVIETKAMDDEEDEDGEYKENAVKSRLLEADSKEERMAYLIKHFTEGYHDDDEATPQEDPEKEQSTEN